MQKPLAAGQGKTVPGAVPLAAVGRSAPCGPPRRPAGKIPEADEGGRAAPTLLLCYYFVIMNFILRKFNLGILLLRTLILETLALMNFAKKDCCTQGTLNVTELHVKSPFVSS